MPVETENQTRWKQPKPCQCNPVLHEECWNTWKLTKNGGVCVICRDESLIRRRHIFANIKSWCNCFIILLGALMFAWSIYNA